LVCQHTGKLIAQWTPGTNLSITHVAASPCQVLVAGGGGSLWLLDVTKGALDMVGCAEMEAEVTCLDLAPAGEGS
jgi:hypothetical protein